MAASKYCVILHAGTTDSWQTNLANQKDLENILQSVVQKAGSQLAIGARALDVVQSVVSALEDCPHFNAGKGAVLNEDGKHELEAAIVDGATGAYGAVACVENVKNPINASRAVLDTGRACFLVGHAADAFAKSWELEMVSNEFFTTDTRKSHWEARMSELTMSSDDLETVGAVALDLHGNLAAAGSTGGMTGKMKGRLGDTAVVGAGIYADKKVAIACSGSGDDILRHCVSSKIAAHLQQGKPLDDAVTQAITNKAIEHPSPCAAIAISAKGELSVQSSGRVFLTASQTPSGSQASLNGTTIPLLPHHTFFQNACVSVGLTRYPITSGHTVVVCHGTQDLFSLSLDRFLLVLSTARPIAKAVGSINQVHRCGLVNDGSGTISLVPLHGLSDEWKPILHNVEEYDAIFPGYLTSKNGPKLDDGTMDRIRTSLGNVTGIQEPFNNWFDGSSEDQNLFARIIRGELAQWRIWEDELHVAFLTPFANAPGYTVLVPRKHLSSDIFSLNYQDYVDIVTAAHTVAQHLKVAFGVKRCGIIFEGYEIDYAHVKLIPVHEQQSLDGTCFTPIAGPACFQQTYPGYLTSQFGPLASDLGRLSELAIQIRELLRPETRIMAPKTWQQPETHSLQAMNSPWYAAVFALQNTLFHTTTAFFKHQLGYKYAFLPATTDSISSPMGLGSDSLPVHVALHGQNTYLADSMQFTLEYLLRMEPGLKGAYYVGCSFRGEDHDETHLNQFFHIECELLGTLDDGIDIAERYIATLASSLLEKNQDIITASAGSTSHITALLSQLKLNGGKIPRITLADAMATLEQTKLAVPDDPSKGYSLTRAGEQALIKKFNGAVWLTELDHLSVPFYQAYVTGTNKGKALCADLLLGIGETLGLGQRHVDAEMVREALHMHEVPVENYEWYLGIRDKSKRGSAIQTTGWGMGMEQFLAWVLKHDDIRDLAIVPRLKGTKFHPWGCSGG